MTKGVPRIFRLRYKLILFCVPFLLIPILILGVYLTAVVGQSSIEQSILVYRQSTSQLRQNILNELEGYYSIGYDIASDANVAEYLGEYGEGGVYLFSFYVDRIQTLVSKAAYREPDIQIHIYTPNQNLKFSGLFIRDRDLFYEKRQAVRPYMSSAYWEGVVEKTVYEDSRRTTKRYLSFLMPIAQYKLSTEATGVLEICTDISHLEQFIANKSGEENIVLMTDGQNRPVICNDAVTDGLLKIARDPAARDGAYVDYNGKEYLLTVDLLEDAKLGLSGWKLCNLIPLDYVYRNRAYIRQANAVACVLCVLIALPLLILFSHTITKRLEYLASRMNDIRHGEYGVSVEVPGRDEIARLGRQFNLMLGELDLLTKQTVEAKLKEEQLDNAQKEAQLRALQSQINPHYLFNTLESIRMSLILKGDKQTAELIRIFAESFREMIDGTQRTITVREEIAFVRRWFTIQEFRYGGRIRLSTDVPAELERCRIPKFLIQPLVENAVCHGLELKEEGGSVRLSVSRRADFLDIEVRDDGVGMGEEERETLIASLESERESGRNYALRNIAKRLRLLYGGRASVTIQSERGRGTSVRLRLPAVGEEEGADV